MRCGDSDPCREFMLGCSEFPCGGNGVESVGGMVVQSVAAVEVSVKDMRSGDVHRIDSKVMMNGAPCGERVMPCGVLVVVKHSFDVTFVSVDTCEKFFVHVGEAGKFGKKGCVVDGESEVVSESSSSCDPCGVYGLVWFCSFYVASPYPWQGVFQWWLGDGSVVVYCWYG